MDYLAHQYISLFKRGKQAVVRCTIISIWERNIKILETKKKKKSAIAFLFNGLISLGDEHVCCMKLVHPTSLCYKKTKQTWGLKLILHTPSEMKERTANCFNYNKN